MKHGWVDLLGLTNADRFRRDSSVTLCDLCVTDKRHIDEIGIFLVHLHLKGVYSQEVKIGCFPDVL